MRVISCLADEEIWRNWNWGCLTVGTVASLNVAAPVTPGFNTVSAQFLHRCRVTVIGWSCVPLIAGYVIRPLIERIGGHSKYPCSFHICSCHNIHSQHTPLTTEQFKPSARFHFRISDRYGKWTCKYMFRLTLPCKFLILEVPETVQHSRYRN